MVTRRTLIVNTDLSVYTGHKHAILAPVSAEMLPGHSDIRKPGFLDLEPFPALGDLPSRGLANLVPLATTADFLSVYRYAEGGLLYRVRTLPILDIQDINISYRARILLMYSLIANGLINDSPHKPNPRYVPKGVAEPIFTLSQALDVSPGLSYWQYILLNTQLKNDQLPPTLDNLQARWKFTGLESEEMFICLMAAIEAIAKPIVAVSRRIAEGKFNREELKEDLPSLVASLVEMQELLQLFSEVVLPAGENGRSFLSDVVPYFKGGKDIPYEGINPPHKTWMNMSMAQSPLGPLIDALCGVAHIEPVAKPLNATLSTLPARPRDIIRRSKNKLRGLVVGQEDSQLTEQFNYFVELWSQFRGNQLHLNGELFRKEGQKPDEEFSSFVDQVRRDILGARL